MKYLIATVFLVLANPAFAQEYSSLPAPYPAQATTGDVATTAQAYEAPLEEQTYEVQESPAESFYYSSDDGYSEETDGFAGMAHMNF